MISIKNILNKELILWLFRILALVLLAASAVSLDKLASVVKMRAWQTPAVEVSGFYYPDVMELKPGAVVNTIPSPNVQWEYRFISGWHKDRYTIGKIIEKTDIERELNAAGSEGWEVAFVRYTDADGNFSECLLRRPVPKKGFWDR